MKIPKGFQVEEGSSDDYVLRINRNVYGQKQAGRVWNDYLVDILINKLNFVQSKVDECVFYKGKTMYLSSANNLKFIHKILPRSKFEIFTKVKSFNRGIAICNGEGKVNNLTVCKADFVLILPDELKKYNISK